MNNPLPNAIAAERELIAMLHGDPGLVPIATQIVWPDDMYAAANVHALEALGEYHARTPSTDPHAIAKVTELAQLVRDAALVREAAVAERVRDYSIGEVE